MGLIESLPVQRVRPVLALPLWMGTMRDHSGYGNHIASVTAPIHWEGTSGRDGLTSPSTGFAQVTADQSLMLGDHTFFVMTSIRSQKTNEYMIRNNGGVYFYRSAANLIYYDGAAASAVACDTVGATSLAVTATAETARPVLYCDGVSPGAASVVTTPAFAADYWRLFGFAGNNGHQSPGHGILVFPEVLTPAEIADLHTWSQDRFTPRKQWPGGGLDIPTLTGTARMPMFLDSIQSERVTLANETTGKLSNGPFDINTGTWALAEDAIGKYYLCVGAGQLQYGLLGAAGHTVDLFTEEGGATITLNANDFTLDAGNGDIIRAVEIVA